MKKWLHTWQAHPGADLALGSVAAVLGLVLGLDSDQIDPATFYQVCGGTGAALIAFVVTPIAVLLSLQGGRLFSAFDKAQRPRILRWMSWAFGLNLALLVVAILGSLADSEGEAVAAVRLVALGLAVACILATGRLFWSFVAALKLHQSDRPDHQHH